MIPIFSAQFRSFENEPEGAGQTCCEDPTVVVERVDQMKTGIVSADCVAASHDCVVRQDFWQKRGQR